MSPCMADTVKLFCRIFSVSQSTLRLVLQKMTAWQTRPGCSRRQRVQSITHCPRVHRRWVNCQTRNPRHQPV